MAEEVWAVATMRIKTYSELIQIPTFEDRYAYLRLGGRVGEETFGFERNLNQSFYRSYEWRKVRREVIARDAGCDLAMPGFQIYNNIIIHHIVPITIEDLEDGTDLILDPNNLVCVSEKTHNAIHFGDKSLLPQTPIERRPGDTCPWKR